MLKIRKSEERGHVQFTWLDTRHSFSFGSYYDPSFMGFRNLRVINEDKIAPGRGFPTHGHQDMEIISYMISGAMEHKDSMGNCNVIRPGEIQHMSAGSGIRHIEYNASDSAEVHVLLLNLRRYTRCGEFGFPRSCAGFHADVSRRNYPYCLNAPAHRNHVSDNLHVLMTVTWGPTTGSDLDFIDHS